ncbi:MAG: hypothetical protein ACOX7H_00705 [Bacillota bacterium]
MTEEKNKPWYSPPMMENPFFHPDITPEEYDVERAYFVKHWDNYKRGLYKLLWKQQQENVNR